MVMEIKTIISTVGWIGFYTICGYVSYQLNKSLHKDIFPPREWKFISEVDGKEYTIVEHKGENQWK